MSRTKNFLGSFYWDQKIGVEDIGANSFDFELPEDIEVLEKKNICPCGNYGQRVSFKYKGEVYSFDYLTGYP